MTATDCRIRRHRLRRLAFGLYRRGRFRDLGRRRQGARACRACSPSPRCKPIGLGARDSLRLEAGLCLYGHDIDETTSPVEADLVWSIGKRRRNEGGFPAPIRIGRELTDGLPRQRVGIRPEGRAPAREGTRDPQRSSGESIGTVTSGGFGPTSAARSPWAMSQPALPKRARRHAVVRGKPLAGVVARLPFVPHNYKR